MSETLVRMPKLADTLVEGTLGQWLKHVGDTVGQGEALASIETDKVTTELTSPAAGTLLEVLIPEGETVPIETVIARIGTATTDVSDAHPPGPPTSIGAPKPTPVAARLLAEHGLSASQVPSATGRLTKDDVLQFIESRQDSPTAAARADRMSMPTPADRVSGGERAPVPGSDLVSGPVRGELVPLAPMRRAIAEHMARAYQTIPHGQTVMDADLTHLVTWREQHKVAFQQQEGANLTFTVLFVHSLARALAAPKAAQTSRADSGGADRPVDLGVAVALPAGLIVPVVRAADLLSLGATARAIADLATRARSNKLAPDETQGALMTVTNVGSFGNLTASPIIPLGQLGILGPGLVERRPLPAPDGGIRPGWRCLLSLMFDRREIDDLTADRLLRQVISELTHIPAQLLQ